MLNEIPLFETVLFHFGMNIQSRGNRLKVKTVRLSQTGPNGEKHVLNVWKTRFNVRPERLSTFILFNGIGLRTGEQNLQVEL